MTQFMVVSTFFEGVDMQEVLQVVEEEKAKVKELQEQGRLGQIRLAVPQGKVFLDVLQMMRTKRRQSSENSQWPGGGP